MLTLQWTARFKDGTVIDQYEQLDLGEFSSATPVKEHLFKEVLDRQKDLSLFGLVHSVTKEVYLVNLEQGHISKATIRDFIPEPRADMLRKDQYEYRLIYFREVCKQFGNNMKQIGKDTIVYFLGCQYTDENGKNHKKVIQIQEDGNWVVN